MVLIKNAAVSTVKNMYVRDQRQNDLIIQFDFFFLRSSADMKTFYCHFLVICFCSKTSFSFPDCRVVVGGHWNKCYFDGFLIALHSISMVNEQFPYTLCVWVCAYLTYNILERFLSTVSNSFMSLCVWASLGPWRNDRLVHVGHCERPCWLLY